LVYGLSDKSARGTKSHFGFPDPGSGRRGDEQEKDEAELALGHVEPAESHRACKIKKTKKLCKQQLGQNR
jgi:hypothetical protein